MKKDFIFGKCGRTLMTRYGFNPLRIVRDGQAAFAQKMKNDVPRIRKDTIGKIFAQAGSSARKGMTERQSDLLSINLGQRWEDLERCMKRKMQARTEMEVLYHEVRRLDSNLPAAQKGVVTTFHLSRIIAETGPLNDFENSRKLLRFAGLNLRERQSGLYRGKTKISKKGRPLLRKILKLTVLPLVKEKGIYGEYYKKKKETDKMPGTKALTVIARHFLKMLFGVYKSGARFDADRIFVCESQFKKAA